MSEEWRPIPGWEHLYEVSDFGNVRSLDRITCGRNGKPRKCKGRVLRPQPKPPGGYLQVTLSDGDRKWSIRVHQLVMRVFVGPPAVGQEVAHRNGRAEDCRLTNLRYDTPTGNHADKRKHGTMLNGEDHQNTVLTEEHIAEIRALPRGTRSNNVIARWAAEHGVSKGHVYNVRYGSRRANT